MSAPTLPDVADVPVPVQISEPGVYDLPADVYHADPVAGGSLSSSGARKLLAPSCPARFQYDREHPAAPKAAFDLGHAAHKVVLGAGPELVRIDADEWRTNKVKAEVADVRAAGGVPLKPIDYGRVMAMAEALRRHPLARVLFDPAGGVPEQVLVWRDDPTGVWRRAMLDWRRGRIIVDYKTADSAAPEVWRKSVASYGYHQQDQYYRDGVTALGLADEPAFVFVVQEKTPPFLVAVYDLDDYAIRIGRERNRRALEVYRDCTASGVWPAYSPEVETIALPRWAEYLHEHEDVTG
jgi:hypothetical protein